MVKQQIFADYNATTPVAPEVFEAMRPYLQSDFGNPSSWHQRGQRAKVAVEQAREQVAQLLGCSPSHIRFTGGATEANNWVIKGYTPESPPHHILSSAIEHPSILECGRYLEQRGWAEFSKCRVDAQGLCSPQAVLGGLRPNTQMVCVMLANNETGAIQPIQAIARCLPQGCWLHCDASQAAGKTRLDVVDLQVSSLTIAGHKLYAPKGVGALYVDPGRAQQLTPLLHGPSQEAGQRAGTEAVASIVGLGAACALANQDLEQEVHRLTNLRDRLWNKLHSILGDRIQLNGPADSSHRLPHTLSVNFRGVTGQELLRQADVACSTGPACHDGQNRLSHVLEAMGVPFELGKGAVRVSLGRYSTPQEVDELGQRLLEAYQNLIHSR